MNKKLQYDGPVVLAILDGVGLAPDSPGNAVSKARTPFLGHATVYISLSKLPAKPSGYSRALWEIPKSVTTPWVPVALLSKASPVSTKPSKPAKSSNRKLGTISSIASLPPLLELTILLMCGIIKNTICGQGFTYLHRVTLNGQNLS